MKQTKSEYWDISKLKLWDKNPRSIKRDRFDELKNRINRLGQTKPLRVTEDGTVVGGNMRLRAYQDLGIKEIWVSISEAKTDREIFDEALTDNEEFGYYEKEQVAELAMELGLEPLELASYQLSLASPTSLSDILDELGPEITEEDDEAPEVDELSEAQSKLGEVYQLGSHRLMCGNSTEIEDGLRLMDGKKADMVFTDPPYALFGNSTGAAVADDKMIRPFFRDIGRALSKLTKRGGHFYSCLDWKSWAAVLDSYSSAGLTVKNMIVWDKGSGALGQAYRSQHELIMFGICDHAGISITKSVSVSSKLQITDVNVWSIPREDKKGMHAALKPQPLMERAVKNSSSTGDIVLDLFGGSGSTLIACEKTNRICYMMELDPKYVDVIRKRYWKHATGIEEGWEDGTRPA